MKVLLLNCVFGQGSTGKIVVDTRTYLLSRGIDVYVAYGNFGAPVADNVYKFGTRWETKLFSGLTKLGYAQYASSPFATRRLLHYIEIVNPDVVHLHCMNGYCVNVFSLLKFLSKRRIKTVVTHHGEFYYTGNCEHAYECDKFVNDECRKCVRPQFATKTRTSICPSHYSWICMHEAFERFRKDSLVFTSVSPWVRERSLRSPLVNQYDCRVVKNGLETSIFHRRDTKAFAYLGSSVFSNTVLHVTAAFVPHDKEGLKGGYYLVELAKQMPYVRFVVVASYIKIECDLPSNIVLYGKVTDQNKLAELYSSSDATVITSKRETFSMVTAESLCSGTPVVGFKAGGPESIALEEYASFVEYGKVEDLKSELSRILNSTFDRGKLSEDSQKVYSKETMASEYLTIYEELYNR